MINKKVNTVQDALQGIENGMTIMLGGFGLCGIPENSIAELVKKENLFQPKDKLLLAVSGGVDSVVLCELCKQCGFDFVIAHCNFQLRGTDSTRDEKFVAALAQKYDVPFSTITFDTNAIAAKEKK